MIKIEIEEGNNSVSVAHEENGVILETYQTSLYDLFESFKKAVQERQGPESNLLAIHNGLKAKDALFEIPIFNTHSNEITAIKCGFIVSKGMWPCTYFDTKYDSVGLPHALIILTYDGKFVKNPYIFALKTDEVDEGTFLYNWPFPNIYNDGRVCMGQNSCPEIQTKHELVSVTRWLLQLPYLNDLYNPTTRNVPKMNPRELFNKLSDKEFPDEWLIKCSSVATIGNFMEKL